MKRSIFPRMAGLIFLYLGVFVVLVTFQFTKQRGFTRYIGPMLVSGHYRESSIRTADAGGETLAAVYPLEGGVTVSFGGMEFRLHDEGEFVLLLKGGEKDIRLPQTMSINDNSAIFSFGDGTRLVFNVINGADASGPELRITGQFGEGYEGLELPYRILRSSRIQDAGGDQFVVMAEGIPYSFGLSQLDDSRRVVILNVQDPAANYRAVPKQEFVSKNFILSTAQDETLYTGTVNRWRDAAYSLWSRAVRNTDDEALVVTYIGESASRGVYREAVANISSVFLRRVSWSYNASVYLGRLDLGLRSLSAFERDAASRLSALIAAKSPDFFLESHVIEFCGIRGYGQIIDGAAELARSLDPASLSPGLIPGILEAYIEWNVYRSRSDNPFERFVESACLIIDHGLRQTATGARVLYFLDGRADTEYNLRLGLALDRYGRFSGQEDRGALGRSLVISILSLTEDGSLPAELTIPDTEKTDGRMAIPGIVSPVPGRTRIDSLILYRHFPAATYPHATSIGPSADGIWAWTASDSVTISRENDVLDIAVSFPVGETHYMLIRGLSPFAKIQLYGIDYRTDSQFERYDSSGWSFSPSEQTLLLKLKHRSAVEHIKVFGGDPESMMSSQTKPYRGH
ncbi:MAG: hypothetical protein LBB98_11220 [Treponema sp.]|jgi:hypothetical protein|nr:hypothetical protein [Treponema sp.]